MSVPTSTRGDSTAQPQPAPRQALMPLWVLFFEGVLSVATTLGGAFSGRPSLTLCGLGATLASAFLLVNRVRWPPHEPTGTDGREPSG